MWNKEANAGDRRFLKDLDSNIELAEAGDLHQTFNILSYFGKKVSEGTLPDVRVTRFVSDLLISSQPPQRLKRWERDQKLKIALKNAQANGKSLKPSQKESSAAKEVSESLIADGYPIGESRVLAIKYSESSPLLALDKILRNGRKPKIANLRAILPAAEDLYRRLLKPQEGKRVRPRLHLNDSKHPSLSNLIDQEIDEKVDKLIAEGNSITAACKLIAKEFGTGYTWEKIKKTWYRHKQAE